MVTFVQLCHEIMCYYGIVIKDIKSSPLTFMIVIKTSEMVSFSNDFLGGDYMVMKICRKCGSLIPYPHTYCTKCQNEYNKDREQQLKNLKRNMMLITINISEIRNIPSSITLMNGSYLKKSIYRINSIDVKSVRSCTS